LINLGSSVILNNFFSLSIAGFYSTYFAASACLLWRRLRGDIKEPTDINRHNPDTLDINSGTLTWGPWRFKEPFGTAINIFACAYLVVVIFFSFWPPTTTPTPSTMNYSVAAVPLILIWSVIYYLIWGKHNYNGPIVEVVL